MYAPDNYKSTMYQDGMVPEFERIHKPENRAATAEGEMVI